MGLRKPILLGSTSIAAILCATAPAWADTATSTSTDTGASAVSEIATKEKIDRGYVGTILRLTLLAPDIIEAILNGQATGLSIPRLLEPFPLESDAQRIGLLGSQREHRRPSPKSISVPIQSSCPPKADQWSWISQSCHQT